MKTRRLPHDDTGNGWWALLDEPPPPRLFEGDEVADCAVIGAGFTGLATARRLAALKPDWRVVIVDAQRAGFGTSGRNSGFVGDISHRNPNLDADGTRRIQRVARAGLTELEARVDEHGIECHWSAIGRLHVAVDPTALDNLAHLLGLLATFDEPHTEKSAAELEATLGTPYYRAGVHIPRTVLLDPAALARGLAASLPESVTLYESSPVRSITRSSGWELQVGTGTLTSPRLVLATNGFTPALGFLRRRVLPLATYASLTRKMTPREQSAVGGDREWGLVSEDRMGTSMRRTRDQRFLVRNTVRYTPGLATLPSRPERVAARHLASLHARYPTLDSMTIEHTWGGVLGMTMNQGQCFGRLDDELYVSAGYNGTGVAMGTGSGLALGDLIAGEDSELASDAQALVPASWVPPDPFVGIGVWAMTSYLQWRAGAER